MFCRSALCHARGRWKPLQLSHGCPCPALPALPCALVPRPPGAAFQLIDCTQAVRAAGAGQGRKHALPAPGLAGGAAGGVQRPPPSHPQGPLDVLLLTAFPPTTAPGGGGGGGGREGAGGGGGGGGGGTVQGNYAVPAPSSMRSSTDRMRCMWMKQQRGFCAGAGVLLGGPPCRPAPPSACHLKASAPPPTHCRRSLLSASASRGRPTATAASGRTCWWWVVGLGGKRRGGAGGAGDVLPPAALSVRRGEQAVGDAPLLAVCTATGMQPLLRPPRAGAPPRARGARGRGPAPVVAAPFAVSIDPL